MTCNIRTNHPHPGNLGLGLLTLALLALAALLAPPAGAQTSTTVKMNTTATTPTSVTHIVHVPGAIPRILDRNTSATRPTANPLYTSRPLLAVGTLKRFDTATSTVVIAIDRSRSSMPHVLEFNAHKAGQLDKLQDREFPTERSFHLTPFTALWDARPDPNKPQTRADTGRIREDKQRLKATDFKPGDQVSVYFRMDADPAKPPFVINVCQVDPAQKEFRADIGPPPRPVNKEHSLKSMINPSTATKTTSPTQAGSVKH